MPEKLPSASDTANEYLYDAFISYRHNPLDMSVALRLQQLLERRKGSDDKYLRVFRDQSELPTSGDLGQDIRTALEHSRYLIVICTPAYRESKWCMAELQYFRELHGHTNHHILPLLAEGEPMEAFPELLLWELRGATDSAGKHVTVRTEVEPLGADIRSSGRNGWKKKLQTEYLRIAAPILSCKYDDLYQRAQRYKRNRTLLLLLSILFAAIIFSVYSAFMIRQISDRQQQLLQKQEELVQKQQELYANESRRLANEALSLLNTSPELALLLSDIALPSNLAEPDYPIQSEAELALRSTALQYDIVNHTRALNFFTEIPVEDTEAGYYNYWYISLLHDSTDRIALHDNYTTHLYEIATGNLLATIDQPYVYFFENGNNYVTEEMTTGQNGLNQTTLSIYDTMTSELVTSAMVYESTEFVHFLYCFYDQDSGRCYVLRQPDTYNFDHVHFLLGWFEPSGEYVVCEEMPDIVKEYNESFSYFDRYYREAQDIYLSSKSYLPQYRLDKLTASQQNAITAITDALDHRFLINEITVTEDNRLSLFTISVFDDVHNISTKYTAFWAMEEEVLLDLMEGICFHDPVTDLLYLYTYDYVKIGSYYRDHFGYHIAANGTLVFMSEDSSIAAWITESEADGSKQLLVCDTRHMDQPILSHTITVATYDIEYPEDQLYQKDIVDRPNWKELPYRFTPDGSYLLYETPEQKIRLISLKSEKCLIEIPADYTFSDGFCVDQEGARIAAAYYTDEGIKVRLYNVHSQTVIDSVFIPDQDIELAEPSLQYYKDRLLGSFWDIPTIYTVMVEPHLEFQGDRLLLTYYQNSYLIDLTTGNYETLTHAEVRKSNGLGFYSDVSFTQDGLILIHERSSDTYMEKHTLNSIYDMQTLEEITFEKPDPSFREAFFYDEPSHSLILQCDNTFYVQRRDSSGSFQTVYQITPQSISIDLVPHSGCCDGTYLILSGSRQSEIYAIADGTLLYIIPHETDAPQAYGIWSGSLYDVHMGQAGQITCYPLRELSQWRRYALNTLSTSDHPITLTPELCEQYYLPAEWRPSAP